MKMTWIRALPTEPGWYWIRRPNDVDEQPDIVRVRMYAGELAVGNSTFRNWREDAYEWAGPIPQPVEASK